MIEHCLNSMFVKCGHSFVNIQCGLEYNRPAPLSTRKQEACQQLRKFLADSVVMLAAKKKTKSVILTVLDVGYFEMNLSDSNNFN